MGLAETRLKNGIPPKLQSQFKAITLNTQQLELLAVARFVHFIKFTLKNQKLFIDV